MGTSPFQNRDTKGFLNVGCYYVGFVVDPFNDIPEEFEDFLNSMDLAAQVTVQ